MNTTIEFEPKSIGLVNTKLEQTIKSLYDEICLNSGSLFWNLEFYLAKPDEMKLSVFFEFLKSSDPKSFLYAKYIEHHRLTFPGLDITKVIEMGMVNVPTSKFEELLKDRVALLLQIQKTKEVKFFYPLAKLWNETDRAFVISNNELGIQSPEFDEQLFNFTRNFTTTQRENDILEAMESVVCALNDLVTLKVIRNDRYHWKHPDISFLIESIIFNMGQERPLCVSPDLGVKNGFREHFERKRFVSNGNFENLFQLGAKDVTEDQLRN